MLIEANVLRNEKRLVLFLGLYDLRGAENADGIQS